jgi:hypothetical protein
MHGRRLIREARANVEWRHYKLCASVEARDVFEFRKSDGMRVLAHHTTSCIYYTYTLYHVMSKYSMKNLFQNLRRSNRRRLSDRTSDSSPTSSSDSTTSSQDPRRQLVSPASNPLLVSSILHFGKFCVFEMSHGGSELSYSVSFRIFFYCVGSPPVSVGCHSRIWSILMCQ